MFVYPLSHVPNIISTLLIVMVTTTLTLVVISHRLLDIPDRNRSLKTFEALKGIRWLIWGHLAMTLFILLRIMVFSLFCIFSELNDAEPWLIFDAILVFFVLCMLGVWWPLYFHRHGDGNICKLICGKYREHETNPVMLSPEVAKVFFTEKSVNQALQALIEIAQQSTK